MNNNILINNSHVKNANIKRLTKFIVDCKHNPSEYYTTCQSPDDITIWYVKIHNLADDYLDGEYYLKIHFTQEYPFKPPDYTMLTPSERFKINTKLCFSNSGYHSESWSPLWGINQIIIGFISFFYETQSSGIGHISNSSSVNRKLCAKNSIKYNNIHLNKIIKLFT